MTQKYLATWPESPKRVRKKILTHAKDTPRSHTKLLSSPSRDLASLGIISFLGPLRGRERPCTHCVCVLYFRNKHS